RVVSGQDGSAVYAGDGEASQCRAGGHVHRRGAISSHGTAAVDLRQRARSGAVLGADQVHAGGNADGERLGRAGGGVIDARLHEHGIAAVHLGEGEGNGPVRSRGRVGVAGVAV